MKYIKSYIFFVLMVVALTGCNKYDDLKDDVNDLKDRVTLIEQQVKLLNDNLAVVAYILDTQNKTISKVEKSADGLQHVITLSDGNKLYLTIGKPGTIEEPVITVGEDNMWYINGVSTGIVAVGEDGKNGEGFPEFRVESGKWQVRFGGGEWKEVAGGDITSGSLGDQIFESAKVENDNLVVTLKQPGADGKQPVVSLPIVAELWCEIDLNGNTPDDTDGCILFNTELGVERLILLANIKGDGVPQVSYPQGWRAELKKLEVNQGENNYQLIIYAPVTTKTQLRAVADNAADVTVQVQKGSLWAMDKVKVKVPKVYSTNLEKYNEAQQNLIIGGKEFDYATYGAATEIKANTDITQGGVYIVSANNLTLTYSVATALDKLIIIPNTDDISITMTLNKQVIYNKTLVWQNIVLDNKVNNNPFKNGQNGSTLVVDNCKMVGRGVVTANTVGLTLGYVGITNSDFRFDAPANNVVLVSGMNCDELVFNNNLVYYSPVVHESNKAYNNADGDGVTNNGHFTLFKVFANTTVNLTKATMNNNTFVDVEPNGTSGTVGILWSSTLNDLTMNNNLLWLSYPAIFFTEANFNANKPTNTVTFARATTAIPTAQGNNNYAFFANGLITGITASYNGMGSLAAPVVTEFFDTTNPATFNKSTGVFKPKSDYTQYGAQR